MQESVSMHKNVVLSGIHARIKQGQRKRRIETGKTEARKLMERKAAQQNKLVKTFSLKTLQVKVYFIIIS